MRRTLLQASTPEKAPIASRAGRILSHLRERAERTWRAWSEALSLEAEIVADIKGAIHGEGTLHCGPRSEEAWSDVLDGKRRMLLGDICRLATSSRPKAGEAIDALLDLLAARRGKKLVPVAPSVVNIAEAVGRAVMADGAFVQDYVAATSPDSEGGSDLTIDELRRLREKARQKRDAAEDAEMLLRRAEFQFPGGEK